METLEIVISDYPAEKFTLEEERALYDMVNNRVMAAALKKFFANHERHHTQQARNYLNEDPTSLDHIARKQHLAQKYAAMAKAYGTAWAELEKAAG
jgi:hypothetical protein